MQKQIHQELRRGYGIAPWIIACVAETELRSKWLSRWLIDQADCSNDCAPRVRIWIATAAGVTQKLNCTMDNCLCGWEGIAHHMIIQVADRPTRLLKWMLTTCAYMNCNGNQELLTGYGNAHWKIAYVAGKELRNRGLSRWLVDQVDCSNELLKKCACMDCNGNMNCLEVTELHRE